MSSTQHSFSFPSGLFPTSPYEQLHPFLAVAAAAAEATQPNLQAYSAYYDAVTREATQRLGFYPTSSSLAAAIMGTSNVSSQISYDQEAAILCNSLSYARLQSTQSNMRPASPNFPPTLEPYIASFQSEKHSNKLIDSSESELPRQTSKSQRGSRKNSARLTQTWPCSCSCQSGEDDCSPSTNSKHNSDCSSPMHNHGTIDHMNLNIDSLNGTSIGTLPPFECAKSFIRRRNARERERVRCVNAGYESLRRKLPLSTMPDRRLAKVEILRGAINYIKALKDLLEK